MANERREKMELYSFRDFLEDKLVDWEAAVRRGEADKARKVAILRNILYSPPRPNRPPRKII